MSFFRRKTNRLDRSVYKEPRRFLITICTEGNSKIFTEKNMAVKMVQELRNAAGQLNWDVNAYCFEPDHLHLFVEPQDFDLDLIKFISLFKQKTGYWYKQKYRKKLWQKSFDDRVVRSHESTSRVMQYVFENPVKDGLVEDWRDYPYLGSFVHNLNDL